MTLDHTTKTGQSPNLSRRRFLGQASAAAVSAAFVPRRVLGGPGYTPPSETLNVAIIGAGGQGLHNMRALLQEDDVQIVAIADVMEEADYSQFYYGGTAGRIPAMRMVDKKNADRQRAGVSKTCRGYKDFRTMLDTEKSIDAVLVATPDHMHAVTSLAAIARGKHVYCEKPLARTVYETRRVTEAAKKARVATQMGNHGHSGSGIRMTVEWIRDGVIGDVREVHAWSSGVPNGQFRDRPKERPAIPAGLDWDLWLGPAAARPYHSIYAPYRWRQWWDFGTGTLGDMACHNMDPAFWALDLGHPESVQARCAGLNNETVPYAATVHYQFPKRGTKPPVELTWYSGLKPPRPEELAEGRDLIGGGNGILFVGDKGKLMCAGWAGSPRLVPLEKTREYKKPAASIPRSKGHHRDWIDACKGGDPASSNFDYSGHLAEVVVLGNVAMRAQKKILWDGPNLKALNCPEADAFIRPEYHNGWVL